MENIVKSCMATPVLEVVISLTNNDNTITEVAVREGKLLKDVTYLDENSELKTVSGILKDITFATKLVPHNCNHHRPPRKPMQNEKFEFEDYIKVLALVLDCSTQYNCNLVVIPIEKIKGIEIVEDAPTISVNGVYYNKFADALDAVADNSTLAIIEDIDFEEKVTIPAGKTLNIDLNGHNLTIPTVENNYGMVVKGDFTITGEGNVAVGMYGIGVQPTAKLTIKGGTFKTSGDYLIGSWGETIINGGNFNGNYCCVNGFQGTVEIHGGTFNCIEGETIILGNVKVYGGTFQHPVAAEYCAEGYVPVTNKDGTYTVVKA